VKFAKEENLMTDLPFLLFLASKKLMIQFQLIIYLKNLIILIFTVNFYKFITNLYLTSKAITNYNGKLSTEFPIYHRVSLITYLFNRFINDIFDKYKKNWCGY